MVVEAVQNYVNMVNGLSKMTRERALATARAMLAQAGLEEVANDATERVSKLAEEIMQASRANRELVENLVAAEVDKAAARWGFVRADEVAALREELAELRVSLARATVQAATGAAGHPQPPAAASTATKKTPAKRPGPRARKSPAVVTPEEQPPFGGAPEDIVADLVLPGVSDPVQPPEVAAPIVSAPIVSGPVVADSVDAEAIPPAPTVVAPAAEPPTPEKSSRPRKSAAQRGVAKKSATKKAVTKTAAKRSPAKKAVPPAAAPLSSPPPILDPERDQ